MYFISHSNKDTSFIMEELIPLLDALNVQFWYSKIEIKTGKHWEREIKSSLEECDGFILIMSHHSALSEWVKDEISWAIENRPRKIIPILIEDSQLADFHIRLPRIQYADYFSDPSGARNKLISMLVHTEYVEKNRANRVKGTWQGQVFQELGPNGEPVTYAIDLKLDIIKEHEIKGSISMANEFTGLIYLNIINGIFYDHIMQFNYYSKDPSIIHFGTIIMLVNGTGEKMEGNFLGYGAYSNKIVQGRLSLNKCN